MTDARQRTLAQRGRRLPGRVANLRRRRDLTAEAWRALRSHPALVWTPPVWRTSAANDPDGRQHALHAIDHNLSVDVRCDPRGRVTVVLSVGPLRDRWVEDGVDPVRPEAVLDERVTVEGATFEDALLRLRSSVDKRFGTGLKAQAAN